MNKKQYISPAIKVWAGIKFDLMQTSLTLNNDGTNTGLTTTTKTGDGSDAGAPQHTWTDVTWMQWAEEE